MEENKLEIGKEIVVRIIGVGSQGDGIAKIDGFVLFVKGADEIDKKMRVKVTRLLNRYGFAEPAK